MSPYNENIDYIIKSQAGDDTATEEMIKKNYPLAVSLARKFIGRGVDTEDLIQIALIGMLKAIRSFDTERGTAFSTYAVPLIIGEIKRFLRDDGMVKVSRENKRNSAIIHRFREEYTEKTGFEPHIDEICEHTGLCRDEVMVAIDSTQPVASLSDKVGNDDNYTVINTLEDADASMEKAFDKIALSEALSRLPEESRKLIILRYFRDMSQQQTADILGVTQVKVSREEKRIIAKLRESIV